MGILYRKRRKTNYVRKECKITHTVQWHGNKDFLGNDLKQEERNTYCFAKLFDTEGP